ncbi:MAG: hypothetical protein PF503_14505 [Desulfobacula sp.]|nr:hypothetical protein [Desulfobacula sp.]
MKTPISIDIPRSAALGIDTVINKNLVSYNLCVLENDDECCSD